MLTCRACSASHAVEDGIVDLLVDAPDHVVREAERLERFAARMRADGWTPEMVAGLPGSRSDLDYWRFAGDSMRALLDTVGPRRGERVVDVGSNTCWAAAWFARLGLDVVALDIARAELQGLRTAELHLVQGVYYERLLSTMTAPALASETFDYAFCSEVLHHNDLQELRATLRELHRILRPGGRLLVINERMRFPFDLQRDHAQEVAEYEGHEHVYFLHEYLLAARQAGFHLRLRELVDDPFFDDRPLLIWPEGLSRLRSTPGHQECRSSPPRRAPRIPVFQERNQWGRPAQPHRDEAARIKRSVVCPVPPGGCRLVDEGQPQVGPRGARLSCASLADERHTRSAGHFARAGSGAPESG